MTPFLTTHILSAFLTVERRCATTTTVIPVPSPDLP
eukprot:CAMPEP_0182509042 /NCGR_PEP_ID=MMETSP1321-20130603/26138_1 /TAXON_ID=91990 /ORGANISM="Bolidomonas sp., Strain RCC1657" /LENGTH=35 /DNA_ID= /DNA_START= /DNA_END= /DNA_ORIENTATION=